MFHSKLSLKKMLPVSCLTSRFWGNRQHPEDTHGLVAFVNALVFHLLNVWQ